MNDDIDPNFFRKIANIWSNKYMKKKETREAVNKFAEFIDETLRIVNDNYEKN